MSVHNAVVRYRSQLDAVIEASNNKRAACAVAGIAPSTFYRWRNQPTLPERPMSLAQRRLEEEVVAGALARPAIGPQALSDHLEGSGVLVGRSKVWRILKRHRLNTRQLRYQLLAQHRAEPSIEVVRRRPDRAVGGLDATVPGDLVQMDCFHVGSFKETRLGATKHSRGQIWQYTAIDVASSWLWAQLHATAHNPSPAITSQLAHLVAADLSGAGWQWKAATTDNGNEYRAQVFRDTLEHLGVEHRFIKSGRPQTNGKVERVQRTILEELYQPTLIGYVEPSITGLRRDLTDYITYYNHQRKHNGRWNRGATPATIMTPNPKLLP
ncbi:MAG: integrase core domain-containing protein [Acidimicrobiia bacterium]|nr:integrase core domain-containing protein [Acidimicrobiia bacterium]